MRKARLNQAGFTAIELLVFILVLVIVAVVGISNIRTLRAQNRDAEGKTDINAIYYQLESFYERNGHYPEKVDADTLKGIDPASLKDVNDKTINQIGSLYLYKPVACDEGKCKSFTLRTELEKEAPYIKQSLNS